MQNACKPLPRRHPRIVRRFAGLALLAAGSYKYSLSFAAGHGPTLKQLLVLSVGLGLIGGDLTILLQRLVQWIRCRVLPLVRSTPLLSNGALAVILSLLVLMINAYALHEVWRHGKYLCYENAFDEMSYLQYDFSKACQGLTRMGQCLVTAGHLLGLSGGWINLLFDLATPVLFVLLVRAIFGRLGFPAAQANLAGLGVALLPLLFLGGYNPYLYRLFYDCLDSGWIYWITTSQAWFLPLERTPEPQFSLLLGGLAIYLGLRWRSFLPPYLCLPFLYPFVALPFGFCLFAFHLKTRWSACSQRSWLAALCSFVVISCALFVYLNWIVSERHRELFCATHEPLLSTSGVLALVLYGLLRGLMPVNLRPLGFFIALAPTLVANQQIITGLFSCPHNYEQNFGVISCAVLLVFALVPLARYRLVEYAAVILLAFLAQDHARDVYQIQKNKFAKLKLNERLLETLKNDSANVAINEPSLAAYAALLFPRQPTTVFGFQNTYMALGDRQFDHYLWAKAEILKNQQLAHTFQATFRELDRLYKYESFDFILAHSGRRSSFPLAHDPLAHAIKTYSPLQVFLVTTEEKK